MCHSGNQDSNWFYFLSLLLLHCCTSDYRHGNQTCGELCIIFVYFYFFYIISSNPGPISFRPGQREGTSLSSSSLDNFFLSSSLLSLNLLLSLPHCPSKYVFFSFGIWLVFSQLLLHTDMHTRILVHQLIQHSFMFPINQISSEKLLISTHLVAVYFLVSSFDFSWVSPTVMTTTLTPTTTNYNLSEHCQPVCAFVCVCGVRS